MYRYFQPLMICISPSATYKIIDQLTKKYDAPVKEWSNELKEVQMQHLCSSIAMIY